MSKYSDKDTLLKDIETEHRRLEKVLAELTPQDMIKPGVVGEWSVKDVLAHLVAWEQNFLEWYAGGLRDEIPAFLKDGWQNSKMHEFNRLTFEKHRHDPLDRVMAEFHASYRRTLAKVREIPETDMFTPGRYAWTGRAQLADYIVGNTCGHYRWAKTQIRKWMKAKK